jgi:plastocyanin
MSRSSFTGLLFAVLQLLSCSRSEQNKASRSDADDDYEIAETPAPENEAETHTIEIRQMKFEPEILNVKKGDKIIWINKDIVEHDITELNNKVWASSRLPTGASWSMSVTKTEAYYCNLHVVMKGKVVVDGADISMLSDPSGITICKTIKTTPQVQ